MIVHTRDFQQDICMKKFENEIKKFDKMVAM